MTCAALACPGRSLLGVNARPYGVWARSIFSPRARLLPGIGARLAGHPRLAASVFVGLRGLPGRRLRTAAYHSVSRPLVQRMESRLVVRVAGGARMQVDTSDMMGRVLATSGVWEPHVTAVFPRLLASGDVCVDVGAHVGYYTLLASKLVGPAGRVYALEPADATYTALCSNLALNAVSNVTALRVAAGASDGRARIVDPPPGNSGESAIRMETSGAPDGVSSPAGTVPVRAVSSLLESTEAGRLRLVKIDVEGFEADVLRGLEPLLRSGCRPALIVELHPELADEAAELLGDLSAAYSLTAYELVRNPYLDRFSPVRPPRRLSHPASELKSIRTGRTVNVLLNPENQ